MPIVFTHGPVTITVDGLPASVMRESATVDLAIFPHYYDDEPAAFAENFKALGGTKTFLHVTPEDQFSVRSLQPGIEDGEETFMRSTMLLHTPDRRRIPVPAIEAIVDVLEAERAGTAAVEEEVKPEEVSDVRDLEVSDEELVTMIAARYELIREADPKAHHAYVMDAAIRGVAQSCALGWRNVLSVWRTARTNDTPEYVPADAVELSKKGQHAAGPLVPLVGRKTVFGA